MDELLKRINNLSEKEKELFYRIFEIEIEEAQLTLPSAAQKTFDPSVEHQTIMLKKISGPKSPFHIMHGDQNAQNQNQKIFLF